MNLRIKSDEAHRLARELAELRGDSMTGVVVEALRKELNSERRRREAEEKAQELIAWAKGVTKGKKLKGSSDHSWLYDEDGLPR